MARSEAPWRGDSRLGRQSPLLSFPFAHGQPEPLWASLLGLGLCRCFLFSFAFYVGPVFRAVRDGSLAVCVFLMCLFTFLWDWVLASMCCRRQAGQGCGSL